MDEGILPQLECFLYGQNCTLRRCHCGFIRGMSTVRGGDGSFWTIGAVNLLLLLEILSGLPISVWSKLHITKMSLWLHPRNEYRPWGRWFLLDHWCGELIAFA